MVGRVPHGRDGEGGRRPDVRPRHLRRRRRHQHRPPRLTNVRGSSASRAARTAPEAPSPGSGAACAASADAARVAATSRLATTGTPPATFTDLTSDGTLQLPTGATIDPSGRRLITSSWELVLTPGTAGTPPTFTCTGTTSALALTDLGTTGADAVYSLRRVSIDHTGPVVRVRRSTDNTETDIGTTTAGDLDETALLTFTGTASAFVTTWYDQSGAGRHATQTTTAAQPRIVNAGTIDREGTRPTLVFSGTQFLTMPNTVIVTGNNPSTINTVARRTTPTGVWQLVVSYGAARTRQARSVAEINGAAGLSVYGSEVITSGSSVAPFVGTALFTPTGTAWFHQGAASGTNSAIPNTVATIALIGRQVDGSSSHWNGTISEIVLTPSALTTTQRQTLERNQGTYYAITVA